MTTNPWRLVSWTDENYRLVQEIACHECELDKVLNLPHPPGAVVREPVTTLHDHNARPYNFFRKRPCPFKPGDTFTEFINQADRDCLALAVDPDGRCLYDYQMPNGKTFARIDGKPVNVKKLPEKWRKLLQAENQKPRT